MTWPIGFQRPILTGLFASGLLTWANTAWFYLLVVLMGGLIGAVAGLFAGDRIWLLRHKGKTSMGVFVPALMAALGAELTILALMLAPAALGVKDIGLWITFSLPTVHGLVVVVVFFSSLLILLAVQPLRKFKILESQTRT